MVGCVMRALIVSLKATNQPPTDYEFRVKGLDILTAV